MYEKPECPDLVLKSSEWTVSECVEKIVNLLIKKVGQSFPMYRLVARNTDFFSVNSFIVLFILHNLHKLALYTLHSTLYTLHSTLYTEDFVH